ncbi:ATP-binding cassette domain-containing protein [Gracilimonas sediminicola]|uniref:ATP-binding cassette domain-containing protein n=1 Tax=Gracilimonas sediminicola TaxID=2952158 RepID=A0A9X2RES5_9BACT|nr:ATP-binding cassette domain-containing protein [Gracilimonas sediminicola]MCP9291237.1 ATP-binding cassette domain-containing protein [Gracilimonas sediminicola]
MSKLILDSIFFYYPELKVLQGAFLEVPNRTITCLVGRNGSGKSTLFKIAAGQIQADSGITQIEELRLHKKSKITRFKHLSYLPQKPFLPGSIKVGNLIDKSFADQDEIIGHVLKKRVKNLSTGERRYLEILLVLSLGREFILLDEPFTGLSPILIEKVIEHLHNAKNHGSGILISDHYMRYISEIGESFYLLESGRTQVL